MGLKSTQARNALDMSTELKSDQNGIEIPSYVFSEACEAD